MCRFEQFSVSRWPSPSHTCSRAHAEGYPSGVRPPAAEADSPTDATDPLLADLTEPQRAAVVSTEGPLLVLAAAGSGKTRVITRRIAYLVRAGIPPWSILGLTFTNKAAGEMRSRVESLLGPLAGSSEESVPSRATRGLTLTTFHSLCARLLRRYAPVSGLAGLKPDFTIYDTADQSAMMKRVLAELDLSATNWPPRSVLAAISRAKNDLVDAERYAASARDFYTRTIAKVFSGYEKALRGAGAVDFDDLLVLTARMLRDNLPVRAQCQSRWRYLLIDEYQDTNKAQLEIARLLAGGGDLGAGPTAANGDVRTSPAGPNICVVGDPDQSIYAWRGADISNILDFEKHYPEARVVRLGENFRSTAPILAAADTLIRHNVRRKHKDLFTRRSGGERVQVVICRDEQHEAALVVDWFRSLKESDEGLGWRDMAVFYRTNALSRVIEDGLRLAGIPYVIARGTSFYEREEVRNALAYLRVVANPADDVSLERVINTPSRGIGDASFGRASTFARAAGVPVFEGLRRTSEVVDLSARARSAISKFVEMIDGWTGSGSFMGTGVPMSLADLVSRVIKESGLEQMYNDQARALGAEADEERLGNLDEVVSSAAQFELEYDPSNDPALEGDGGAPPPTPPLLAMLRAYLESVSLVADADTLDPAQGAVSLMTLHAAKGLEYPAVAIIGLEDGMLPHQRVNEDPTGMQLEEERRLCFVGITRAMRRLTMTSASVRTLRGVPEMTIPSRFISELGTAHLVVSNQSEELGGPDEPFADRVRGGVRSGEEASRGKPGGLASKFPVGSRVRHPQFGLGEVVSLTGGAQARAQIRFRDVGTKTLILEYARLQRV